MNNNMLLYDLIIIGSGPGGYVSAIRSSQLGLKTAIIEKHSSLGGTCLNVGCIPSKCILDSSKKFFLAKKKFSSHGIFFENLRFDLKKIINRKNKTIENINNGIKYLMKKNKIDVYHGIGHFITINTLSIFDEISMVEKEKIKFKFCIISTGSKPMKLPHIKKFEGNIISSTEALNIKEIPKKLITIGGGIIGLELSSFFNRLGSDVTIIDNMENIINNMDKSLSNEMKKILEKSSIDIKTNLTVDKIISNNKDYIYIKTKNKLGNEISFKGNYCLISIGRMANTDNLGLNNIGIKIDRKGFILVNTFLQTTVNNIYAIGDVIGGKMLAHKAEEEGLHVVEHIIGQKPNKINYNLIPSIIYTYPEVASVGYTENEIKENKLKYNTGIFPMKALGRSHTTGSMDGFLKMITNKETDEILGVHIISDYASEMIMEAVVSMEFKASSEDIYRICHPHPSLNEAFKEASLLNFENRAIHI
ncbi:dihydrolipoyl dehydrogenase [Blattabacterium cuenoti]|uniref:dihydrolipoyl dehydrogenase n=1 Tax=Blattabacterium cuenoti TaxID=1653831 RepID=UPI00163B9F8D|nr:dihydrolipoyl dehydrogenase [Blattabacterium cuenoti]